MSEIDFNYLVIKIGYILLFARFSILISLIIKYRWVIKSRTHRYLFFYGIIAFLIAVTEHAFIFLANNYTDVILPFLTKYEIDDTFFISPFYFLNEIVFLGLAFSNAIGEKLKKYVLQLVFILAILEILNTLFFERYKDAQTIGSICTSLFLIVMSLIYVSIFSRKSPKSTLKDSFFIISISILVLNLISIIIFVFTKGLFENNTKLYYQISILRMFIDIICMFTLAYGIYLIKKTRLYSQ